ncbi:arrestin domain-containing protein 3-like [Scaptodrosophila lebanonensis]|uniref:Arrestin domain-containing protein 3-like n=1 Tax=Drosophila lebanonensis TaxID=7225 RepID=A0A6J2TD99_DROLE|nr:arrestin domain-containing protein 3-like [Scaptodrosophila lebanonensis]
MTVTCEIEFDDNPRGTYFAGQTLSGRVILTTNKVKHVKAISLTINGHAETRWTQSSALSGQTTYLGREDYITSLTYLMGSDASASQRPIEPGTITYNFNCQIPDTCPSSFEGRWGRVRYEVKVTLVRPWKFDNTFYRFFTVLRVMDLNCDSPLLRMPAHAEILKRYYCWLCRSQPLALQLILPRTGFVPGQDIPVSLLVANDSAVNVDALDISLVMSICYYSQGPFVRTRQDRIVISRLKGDRVLRHCNKLFTYELHVPATPPTCFTLCRIIQIAYQVEVEATVEGFHTNQIVSVPVTIGSVPLSQLVPPQCCSVSPQALDVQTLANATNDLPLRDVSRPWAVDPNIPPPNYEAALYMLDIQPTPLSEADSVERPNNLALDGKTFTPLYPVFSIPSPTAEGEASRLNSNEAATPVTEEEKGTWL